MNNNCTNKKTSFNQVVISTPPPTLSPYRHVQPSAFKTKLTNSIPWKSASQQLIDTLKPESVQEYRGRLNFSFSYDPESTTLYLHVLEAMDLPVRDVTGSSDPYVRAFLLEDAANWKRTQVFRRNLNPKFQQILAFPAIHCSVGVKESSLKGDTSVGTREPKSEPGKARGLRVALKYAHSSSTLFQSNFLSFWTH
ncbi:c2 domain-containing protein [Ditylenchus destructor]|uniref:C2 domain-containing protein n=1 Tax=Ditylenchus destructor TaxID=166010 RepID=A0AAD4N9I9_9BILA|nr:c2 domain-containing protein [Ditylenchus destructor]